VLTGAGAGAGAGVVPPPDDDPEMTCTGTDTGCWVTGSITITRRITCRTRTGRGFRGACGAVADAGSGERSSAIQGRASATAPKTHAHAWRTGRDSRFGVRRSVIATSRFRGTVGVRSVFVVGHLLEAFLVIREIGIAA
jgi:hypothetical protein